MRIIGLMALIAVALVHSWTPSHAQQNSGDTADKTQAASNSGTAPEHLGSSGWTGGSRGQTKDGATTTGQSTRPNSDDPEAAKNQPSMATGEDLKGPPAQFPANKTPE